MAFLIDSDIVIYSIKGDPVVQDNFRKHTSAYKAISVVSFGELLFGAKKSQQSEKNLAAVRRVGEIFPVLEVTRAVMEVFSDLKTTLQKKGRSTNDMDLLIGATALLMNFTLVTNNERHFTGIPGLKLNNWKRGT